MSSMLFRNNADVPTIAKSLVQASMIAFRALFGVELRVVRVDDDLAARETALLLVHVLRPRLHGVDRTLEQSPARANSPYRR